MIYSHKISWLGQCFEITFPHRERIIILCRTFPIRINIISKIITDKITKLTDIKNLLSAEYTYIIVQIFTKVNSKFIYLV